MTNHIPSSADPSRREGLRLVAAALGQRSNLPKRAPNMPLSPHFQLLGSSMPVPPVKHLAEHREILWAFLRGAGSDLLTRCFTADKPPLDHNTLREIARLILRQTKQPTEEIIFTPELTNTVAQWLKAYYRDNPILSLEAYRRDFETHFPPEAT